VAKNRDEDTSSGASLRPGADAACAQVLIWARDADIFADRLGARFPDIRFVKAVGRADALRCGGDCEVLIARNDEVFDGFVAAMPRLRWIQALTTGTDRIEAIADLPPGVIVTAARGFHGPQMSELAFLFMLSLSRDYPAMAANQKERRWARWPQRLLLGKTVVLLGVGAVGGELARRCHAFGMKVLGVDAVRKSAPGVEAMHPPERLAELAGAADFLIVLVPYTAHTHHLVDAGVLDAMQPTSVLVNISRGPVVDEAALIRALAAKRIAGAGLDVFQTEPLPADSPLWDLPNVMITPHIGGMSDIYAEQVMPILIDNIAAYAAGARSRMRYVVQM
jgi:phosphoglycerate dehydrogenase-like enzyme